MPAHRRARSTVTEPGAGVSVEHEHAGACLDRIALDVAAVATDAVGQVDLADLDVPCTCRRDVVGDDHAQVADVDAGVDVRLADGELEPRRSRLRAMPIPSWYVALQVSAVVTT